MNFMSEDQKTTNSVPNPAYIIVDGGVNTRTLTGYGIEKTANDPVNHPSHYTQYPVEVIELTRHMDFCRGNAVKYLARAGFKGGPEQEIQDLEKAEWYVKDAIEKAKKKLRGEK